MSRKSLDFWERYGHYVLMVFPTVDNVVDRAEGCWLIDVDGNRLLDLASGQLCATVGLTHPTLSHRLAAQADRIIHTGTQFLTPAVFEAAQKFANVAPPPLRKSVFLSTGAEANEFAFRVAKATTGRTGIVGLSRGYYGMTLATRSITSIFEAGVRPDASPAVGDSAALITPHCAKCPLKATFPQCEFACLDTSLEILGKRLNNVAAFVIEPIISAGGMIIPPPGYLSRLHATARRHGALLIADEAQTGFGRTGKWFGVEHHDVVPDILVVSKSAGGGFPASGVIISEDLAGRIERRAFTHLSSHQSDPLAATAISAVIDIISEGDLVRKAADHGRYFADQLNSLRRKWPIIADVRGQGLMIGLELSGTPDLPLPPEAGFLLIQLCRRRGVHLTSTYFEPTLRIMPPLIISRDEIDFAVSVLDESLRDLVTRNYPRGILLPENPHSRRFIQRLLGKKDLRDVLAKLQSTPPAHWIKKLSGTG